MIMKCSEMSQINLLNKRKMIKHSSSWQEDEMVEHENSNSRTCFNEYVTNKEIYHNTYRCFVKRTEPYTNSKDWQTLEKMAVL